MASKIKVIALTTPMSRYSNRVKIPMDPENIEYMLSIPKPTTLPGWW